MRTIHSFLVTIIAMMMSSLEALAQDEQKIKVDPGVSVHNYKHPHKAKKADSMQKVYSRSRYSSRVGIVPRSIIAPRANLLPVTPKYKQRPGWSFFKNSSPTPTRLNPLTNPGNYKTQH
ncbi:hypothetical protein [Persicitalea jodogahamensis]|uniref:Uncharacterized protein n=1 Tax=Persicitalea jodogahamensis TaxID=402147 RepID=A0A8J3D3R2_9BACT|nr:hypothetical protein [Persicitalea jodogahamensis]GHB67299.1 hypothetical protein GCM10007390_20760 [Persicitalea jodogahamensis]